MRLFQNIFSPQGKTNKQQNNNKKVKWNEFACVLMKEAYILTGELFIVSLGSAMRAAWTTVLFSRKGQISLLGRVKEELPDLAGS